MVPSFVYVGNVDTQINNDNNGLKGILTLLEIEFSIISGYK